MQLNPKELATVLAALRYWQRDLDDDEPPISEHFTDVEPLTVEEIDDLCTRINTPIYDADIHVLLVDQSDSTRNLPVTLKCHDGVIELRSPGYGTNAMEPGHSGPLYIELYEGHLRVLAWSDINQEDPTHTIDLEGARESNRKEE